MQDISKILLTLVQLFLQYVWVANLFFIIVIIMIEKKKSTVHNFMDIFINAYALCWFFDLFIFWLNF